MKKFDLGTLNWCMSVAASIEGRNGQVTAAIGAEIQSILEDRRCPNPTTPEFTSPHDEAPRPSHSSYVG